METNKVLKLGMEFPDFFQYYENFSNATEIILTCFSEKWNVLGQITLMLQEFFILHKKKFDHVEYVLNYETDKAVDGIPYSRILKLVNLTAVDIGVTPHGLSKELIETVDFCYPYDFTSDTFVTQKPQYKPQMFAIFQTLTSWVWIAILLVFIMMIVLSYITSKSRYPLNYVVLHVFAVLMRQTSIISPSSFAEKILIYSWIIGAMFLCLSYDSVFLSFLAFPPLNKMKHLSDLAKAVEKGDYMCITSYYPPEDCARHYALSENKYLRTIGEDILKHIKLSEKDPLANFIRYSKKRNVAFITDERLTGTFSGKYFISEDNFDGYLVAMIVRKDFCCKKLLDEFVHRIMASGIFVYLSRFSQLTVSFPLKLNFSEEYTSKRQLTLTDVAPAFIFLLSGYAISILCLFGEIWSYRKNNLNYFLKMIRGPVEPYNEVSV